jgi:hypothetical protein
MGPEMGVRRFEEAAALRLQLPLEKVHLKRTSKCGRQNRRQLFTVGAFGKEFDWHAYNSRLQI